MTLVQSSVRTIRALFVRSGFHPIPNFKTKNAQDAFQNYEGARSKVTPKADTTQIRLSQATYNYVEFKLELLETPSHELEDGLTAFARVRALDGGHSLRDCGPRGLRRQPEMRQ
jgi:hypothetical protein